MSKIDYVLIAPNPCVLLLCSECREMFNHNYDINDICTFFEESSQYSNGYPDKNKLFKKIIVQNDYVKNQQLDKFLQE